MERKPHIINVGHVLVKLKRSVSCSPFRKITIKYPSRLDAACTDPGKLYSVNPEDNIYPTGQTITVEPRKDSKIIISGNYDRKSLIKHAVILMHKVLDISTGFSIVVDTDIDLRHCGLGSSASAIQGVGATRK